MYRFTIKSGGKFHNVALGTRYCLTKKTAKSLIDLFYIRNDCDLVVEKLIRISPDIFCWSDCDEDDAVFKYFDEVWKEDEEEY